ncbi:MAG: hypothetical protein M1541_00355 [Acidobacteria bacterium]|nr:hypothetical protein [Acidobacteriota bacterium]
MLLRSTLVFLALAAVMWSPPASAQSFGSSGTTTMSLTVAAEAAIRVDTDTTSLGASGTNFADYTGSTNFTYRVRTKAGGTGSITLRVTSDFPAGGPSVASPPTAGDALSYTCTVASPGTGCNSSQTASTTGETNVATFGANAKSLRDGTGGNSVSWLLTNDPQYSTGTYSATVTFTISTT